MYRYNGKTADVKFDQFDNTFNLLDKTREGKIKLADAKHDQIKFKSDVGEIKKRKQKKQIKGAKKTNTQYNIEMLYKARNKVIKFFDDYSSMVSEAKN